MLIVLARMFNYNYELLLVQSRHYPLENDFSKLSKFLTCPVTGKALIEVQYFQVKTLFIRCEFNIPVVIAFCTFLRQLKSNTVQNN